MLFDHYIAAHESISPRFRRLVLGAICLSLAACGASPATPGPSTPALVAAPSDDPLAWHFSDVANPGEVTGAPSLEPGFHCSPCHPPEASQLFGMAPVADGFIAVGVQQPPARAIVLHSTDGATWTALDGWAAADGTTAIAAASSGSRTVVVGSSGAGAAAWVSDGGTWRASSGADLAGLAGAVVMNSVTATADGWVAGGFRDDPANLATAAAVWRSTDGATWTLDGTPAVFAGGRIQGVAASGTTIVAVGTAGDPSYGPAGAWVSTGGAWTRATIDDAAGVMRAVAATPDGFVAVGQDGTDRGARVWRSTDGRTWTAIADQPALHHGSSPIRMLSLTGDDKGLIAGGWRADAANGSSAAWTSVDGTTWVAVPWSPAFSGGQITGVAPAGSHAIGVGRSGYPDNNQAAGWIGDRP
jgi:hypothetical protein